MKKRKTIWQRRAEKLGEELEEARRDHAAYRAHGQATLAEYLGKLRRQTDTLSSNNMTIQELNDQVAVQFKQRAEAQSDVQRAMKLTEEAVAKHNRMVSALREALDDKLELAQTVTLLRGEIEGLREEVAEAKRTLSYRTARLVASGYSCAKLHLKCRLTRVYNRWLVWRLNKARVTAMSEAGYIPHNLIHMAQKYWEQDKDRMARESGYVYTAKDGVIETPSNSWHRRFRIWLGRA